MGKRACKHKQMNVDHTGGELQLNCLIHGLDHSSDECNVLDDVGN